MDILIPQALLFGDGFPACLAQTWLQLRSLAGEAGRTPPFNSEGLAHLTGKSLATLYRHLRRLKEVGLLDWRCLAAGLQICFEVGEVEAREGQAREEAGEAPDEGRKLKACATGEAGNERPAERALDEGRKLKACATGGTGDEGPAERALDEGRKLKACATGEAGSERPAESAQEEGRKLTACATGEAGSERPAERAQEEGPKLTACATGEAGSERSAERAQEEGRKLKACATGGEEVRFSILSGDSQFCNCASLNTLKDSLINLTRVEARFSKSRMGSISRIELEKTAQAKKTASPAPLPAADSPAGIYRQVARLTPNPAQRDLLQKQVQDLPRWRETLEHWMAHRWNPRNLPGMLDLYRRGGASGCRYCPKPETPKTAEAFKQLRAQYETAGRPGSPIPAARMAGCGAPAGGLAAAGRAE